jgi:hypothetical protein
MSATIGMLWMIGMALWAAGSILIFVLMANRDTSRSRTRSRVSPQAVTSERPASTSYRFTL